ncbi:MAG: response regulator [Deltaproteobacteria bacterium]|nr:response regulator [Deltaproteobacteria bacterium]
MKQVLLVEDEPDVARLVEFNLRAAGFEVVAVGRGDLALAQARRAPPHVVVLDLMLPDTTGYEVCQQLRADPRTADVGVLMLTARGDAEDRIMGLEVGADDYVVKPFVVREVALRVAALAGRIAERREAAAAPAAPSPASARLRAGVLEIDPVTHDVTAAGQPIQLRPLEYKLLALLVASPGKVFSRDDLLEEVWGMRTGINSRTVDVHVRRLRISLGVAADVVETVHGFGYRAKRDA